MHNAGSTHNHVVGASPVMVFLTDVCVGLGFGQWLSFVAQRDEVYQALAILAVFVRGMNLSSVSVLLSALLAFFK